MYAIRSYYVQGQVAVVIGFAQVVEKAGQGEAAVAGEQVFAPVGIVGEVDSYNFV